MLARDGKTLVGRRLVAGDAIVDEASVTVTSPFSLDRVKAQSCALPDGDLLALVDHRQHRVTILEATDELRLWGSYAPGRTPTGGARSGPSLVCDAGSVTLAWATSEPALAGTFPPRAVKDAKLPPGPHPQVVSRIVCRPEGCGSPKEQRLRDLPALWRSEGGYSSPYFLAAVDVEPLGERVLLWWERGGGLYARVGVVGALDGAPLRRILDLAHPRGEEPFVPAAIQLAAAEQHRPVGCRPVDADRGQAALDPARGELPVALRPLRRGPAAAPGGPALPLTHGLPKLSARVIS